MKYTTEELKELRKRRCIKDERDQQIEQESRSWASEIMVAVAEFLLIVSLVKGLPAWRGFLSLVLAGGSAIFARKYHYDREKPYLIFCWLFAIAALICGVWFIII